MSNSGLVEFTRISPNNSGTRWYPITRITIHNTAGQGTVETFGEIFAAPSRKASCNYVVDTYGKVGLIVNESDRSWCSSSADNDHRAVTIETASDMNPPYYVNQTTYYKLIELVADIARRNGKNKIVWLGTGADSYIEKERDATIAYEKTMPSNEIVITMHKWFGDTDCPGQYLISKMSDIVYEANRLLSNGESVEPSPEQPSSPTIPEVALDEPILIGTYYGNTSGGTGKFRVVAQLRYTKYDGSRRYLQRRYYVEVTEGRDYVWERYFQVPWNTAINIELSTAGVYGDTGWIDIGWLSADSTYKVSTYAYYNVGSTLYKSSVSDAYTFVPVQTNCTIYYNDGTDGSVTQLIVYGLGQTAAGLDVARKGFYLVGYDTNPKCDWRSPQFKIDDPVPDSWIQANQPEVSLYAIWKPESVLVTFDDTFGNTVQQTFYYKEPGNKFAETGFFRLGYKLAGWSLSNGGPLKYQTYSGVSNAWVLERAPEITLYAVWENQGTVAVKENGVYKRAMVYVKENGTYKRAIPYVKENGVYKRTSV